MNFIEHHLDFQLLPNLDCVVVHERTNDLANEEECGHNQNFER